MKNESVLQTKISVELTEMDSVRTVSGVDNATATRYKNETLSGIILVCLQPKRDSNLSLNL